MPFGFDQQKLDQLADLGYRVDTEAACIAAVKAADGWEHDADARQALLGHVDDVITDPDAPSS